MRTELRLIVLVLLMGSFSVQGYGYTRVQIPSVGALRMRRSRDCGVRWGRMVISVKGCMPVTKKSQGCIGECETFTKPHKHRPGYAVSCSCCAPISTSIQRVKLYCMDSQNRPVQKYVGFPVLSPKAPYTRGRQCLCRPCS